METFTEAVKYTFTRDELVSIARAQARHHGELSKAEEEFENVKSANKTRVTRIEADIADCTRKVSSGYEMRNVECIALRFRPDSNHSMIVRTDNGRVIRKRKLSQDEKQPTLTETPERYSFEADFYEDSEGDLAMMFAENVPLYEGEAKKLIEALGENIRPLRKLISEAGAEG